MAAAPFRDRVFSIPAAGGSLIPQIGLGTANLKGEACSAAVCSAIRMGYKYIDTALLYENQEAVGEGIRRSGVSRDDVFVVSKVAFFPSSSDGDTWMFNANNLKGKEEASIDLCLEQLGLDYVDLLLVHNPVTTMPEYRAASCPHFFELFSHSNNPKAVPTELPDSTPLRALVIDQKLAQARSDQAEAAVAAGSTGVDAVKARAREARAATWNALERAHASGKAKMIGVSEAC